MVAPGLVRCSAWAGQRFLVSRRDKHCLCASGAEVAEPAQRATELARRRGLQHAGSRAIEADLAAISPGPGRAASGGWWRPRRAHLLRRNRGRREPRASFLNIHVPYTHATSHQPSGCHSHGSSTVAIRYCYYGFMVTLSFVQHDTCVTTYSTYVPHRQSDTRF